MKIDLEFILAALDSVLKKNNVAPFGAIPIKMLMEHWESTRLRLADLAEGIEVLRQQGIVDLETKQKVLWIRRNGQDLVPHGASEQPTAWFRRLAIGSALLRLRLRRNDGFSGSDRRVALNTFNHGKTGPGGSI